MYFCYATAPREREDHAPSERSNKHERLIHTLNQLPACSVSVHMQTDCVWVFGIVSVVEVLRLHGAIVTLTLMYVPPNLSIASSTAIYRQACKRKCKCK